MLKLKDGRSKSRVNGVSVCVLIRRVEAIHHLQSSSTAWLVLCLSDKLLRAHYANSNEGGHRNAISDFTRGSHRCRLEFISLESFDILAKYKTHCVIQNVL